MTNANEVRDYLVHLTEVKRSIKPPMALDLDGELHHILDGDGRRVFTCTEQVYMLLQELT